MFLPGVGLGILDRNRNRTFFYIKTVAYINGIFRLAVNRFERYRLCRSQSAGTCRNRGFRSATASPLLLPRYMYESVYRSDCRNTSPSRYIQDDIYQTYSYYFIQALSSFPVLPKIWLFQNVPLLYIRSNQHPCAYPKTSLFHRLSNREQTRYKYS